MNLKSAAFPAQELGRREFPGFSVFESLYQPEQLLPKHSHEHTYISIVLRGSYSEACERSAWDCEAGQTILHIAGECHSNHFHRNGANVLNLELFPSFLSRLCECTGASASSRTLIKSAYSLQLGVKLHKEFSSGDPWSALAVEGLTMELLAEILRQGETRLKSQGVDWLGKVTETLHDRFQEQVTLSELAAAVSVHPVHLARAFRKRYLCSVGDYMRRLRIDAACHALLNSETPIVEIAMHCGFSDQSHLCRTLKQYTGMSPRHFRRVRLPQIN
jgi:AraC family transcriptional regulator